MVRLRLFALALLCVGCTSTRQRIVLADELLMNRDDVVLSVRMSNGERVVFADPGGRLEGPATDNALATGVTGASGEKFVRIPRTQLAEAELRKESVNPYGIVSITGLT